MRETVIWHDTTTTVLDDPVDRKSTRLNSSHSQISYAVFCLKKKMKSCSSPRSGLADQHRQPVQGPTAICFQKKPVFRVGSLGQQLAHGSADEYRRQPRHCAV